LCLRLVPALRWIAGVVIGGLKIGQDAGIQAVQ
jgi:hypothetical protein